MTKISKSVLTETSPHHFETEASTAGFGVGQWPQQISVENLGNGQPLTRVSLNLEYATYDQNCGCIRITIYND